MKYNDNGNYEDIVIKAVAPGRNSYSTSTSEVYSCDYTNKIVDGYVLYNDDNGTNGTVTLNDSAANYNRIKIFYKDNDGFLSPACEVENPNGKRVLLQEVHFDRTTSAANMTAYIKTKEISISGTSITNIGYSQIGIGTTQGTGSGAATPYLTVQNHIYITKVIGYK